LHHLYGAQQFEIRDLKRRHSDNKRFESDLYDQCNRVFKTELYVMLLKHVRFVRLTQYLFGNQACKKLPMLIKH